MTSLKKIITVGAMVVTLGAAQMTAFAGTSSTKIDTTCATPTEIVAQLTGRTVRSILTEKSDKDVTCKTIAKDAGKFDEFQKLILQCKKDIINKQVKDGKITKEKAEKIIKEFEENIAKCNTTTSSKLGKKYSIRFNSNSNSNSNSSSNSCKNNDCNINNCDNNSNCNTSNCYSNNNCDTSNCFGNNNCNISNIGNSFNNGFRFILGSCSR